MTEILKCLMLPDVEPFTEQTKWTDKYLVVAEDPKWSPAFIDGPSADSPEEAIALWNAWMQPLHDLKAERDQFERIAMDAVEMNVQQEIRLAELESVNRKLLQLLRETTDALERYVHDAGGCDHAVGLCICDDQMVLADAREMLGGKP